MLQSPHPSSPPRNPLSSTSYNYIKYNQVPLSPPPPAATVQVLYSRQNSVKHGNIRPIHRQRFSPLNWVPLSPESTGAVSQAHQSCQNGAPSAIIQPELCQAASSHLLFPFLLCTKCNVPFVQVLGAKTCLLGNPAVWKRKVTSFEAASPSPHTDAFLFLEKKGRDGDVGSAVDATPSQHPFHRRLTSRPFEPQCPRRQGRGGHAGAADSRRESATSASSLGAFLISGDPDVLRRLRCYLRFLSRARAREGTTVGPIYQLSSVRRQMSARLRVPRRCRWPTARILRLFERRSVRSWWLIMWVLLRPLLIRRRRYQPCLITNKRPRIGLVCGRQT